MFELLLQADKSMADGLIDQAERTYWQLIELDPTTAIAVAGLARVSLERGDQRLARTFADRAVAIDPDNIAARKVILALDEEAPPPAGSGGPELQLQGAERLEELSRRRTAAHEVGEGAEAAEQAGDTTGSSWVEASAQPGTGSLGQTASPGEPGPTSSEDSRERQRAGRLGAAAEAAAAEAAREPGHARHESHRAMPSGRHLFQPETAKIRPTDPFSEAEMAAVVAAVDSLDDTLGVSVTSETRVEAEAAVEAEAPVGAERPVEAAATAEPDVEHVLEAVQATEARESVALRLAFLSSGVEFPPEPETPADAAGDRSPESSGQAERPEPPEPIDRPEPIDGPEPVESAESAWWTVAEQATGRPVQGADPDPAGRAAEVGAGEAAAGSAAGTHGDADTDSLMMTEPYRRVAATSSGPPEAEASEAEAEAQALREAFAIVMARPDPAGAAEGTAETAGPVAWISKEQPAAGASMPATAPVESAPRKKGLFRRFRGS